MAILLVYNEYGLDREVKVTKEQIAIGRREDNDIVLDDIFVSRNHAYITKGEGEYILKDNGSTYGTFVNGKKTNQCVLRYGDEIRLGNTIIAFIDDKMVDRVKITLPSRVFGEAVDLAHEFTDLKEAIMQGLDREGVAKEIDRIFVSFEDYKKRYEELERSSEMTNALYEVSKIINFVFDLRVLLNLIMDLGLKITRAERGFVMLYDETRTNSNRWLPETWAVR